MVFAIAVAWYPLWAADKKLDSGNTKEVYELQERCGKRAGEWFKEFLDKEPSDAEGTQWTTTYTNHYNSRLNKCFAVAKHVGTYIGKSLWDINENKKYGSGTFSEGGKGYFDCELVGKTCHSEQEWDALVKPYMEQ